MSEKKNKGTHEAIYYPTEIYQCEKATYCIVKLECQIENCKEHKTFWDIAKKVE